MLGSIPSACVYAADDTVSTGDELVTWLNIHEKSGELWR